MESFDGYCIGRMKQAPRAAEVEDASAGLRCKELYDTCASVIDARTTVYVPGAAESLFLYRRRFDEVAVMLVVVKVDVHNHTRRCSWSMSTIILVVVLVDAHDHTRRCWSMYTITLVVVFGR